MGDDGKKEKAGVWYGAGGKGIPALIPTTILSLKVKINPSLPEYVPSKRLYVR